MPFWEWATPEEAEQSRRERRNKQSAQSWSELKKRYPYVPDMPTVTASGTAGAQSLPAVTASGAAGAQTVSLPTVTSTQPETEWRAPRTWWEAIGRGVIGGDERALQEAPTPSLPPEIVAVLNRYSPTGVPGTARYNPHPSLGRTLATTARTMATAMPDLLLSLRWQLLNRYITQPALGLATAAWNDPAVRAALANVGQAAMAGGSQYAALNPSVTQYTPEMMTPARPELQINVPSNASLLEKAKAIYSEAQRIEEERPSLFEIPIGERISPMPQQVVNLGKAVVEKGAPAYERAGLQAVPQLARKALTMAQSVVDALHDWKIPEKAITETVVDMLIMGGLEKAFASWRAGKVASGAAAETVPEALSEGQQTYVSAIGTIRRNIAEDAQEQAISKARQYFAKKGLSEEQLRAAEEVAESLYGKVVPFLRRWREPRRLQSPPLRHRQRLRRLNVWLLKGVLSFPISQPPARSVCRHGPGAWWEHLPPFPCAPMPLRSNLHQR
jgi:hypothetical protein